MEPVAGEPSGAITTWGVVNCAVIASMSSLLSVSWDTTFTTPTV